MSINSNFKKSNCWSCEFFSGHREYKKVIILGDSVETAYKGKCSNQRSTNFNHEVTEDGWCSKYQKWSVLQSSLALEAQKRESQKIQTSLNKNQ